MKLKVCYASLHSPFFFLGVNFGDKLDIARRADLTLEYDKEEQELAVTFKGKTTFLPSSNIVHYTPADSQPVAKTEAPKPVGKIKAQVNTPTSHVEDGLGHGKS